MFLAAWLGEWGPGARWVGVWIVVESLLGFTALGMFLGAPNVLTTFAPALLVAAGGLLIVRSLWGGLSSLPRLRLGSRARRDNVSALGSCWVARSPCRWRRRSTQSSSHSEWSSRPGAICSYPLYDDHDAACGPSADPPRQSTEPGRKPQRS